MNHITARLFVEFVDNMTPGDEFTITDFKDYVNMRAPRHVPSTGEVVHLTAINKNVERIDKIGRWAVYKVVA